MPSYTNSVAPTSQATTVAGNSLVIPYGNISLITGVPHKYQLEVERVFTADKNGSTVYITQLLSDAAVSIENKRNVFIIPEVDPSNTNTVYWTINEVTKEITIYTNPQTNQQNIGNRIFTANSYSIAVPPISNSNIVTIRRKTISNQPLVTWTPGNTLTSNQLNLETTQLLYLLQEVLDKVYRQISIGGDIVSQIADNSVSTNKIVDLNVTTGKINNLAITDAKLASDSVTTSKILNSNVTTAKIADYNITPAKLINTTQAWSLTGTLALTDLATSATGDKVTNKNYVLDRVSKYGIITKDSTVTSNVFNTPPTIPTDANDDISLQSGGIWFNPRDGGLRVRVLDKWVRVTGTPLNITDYISTSNTSQTKIGNLTLNNNLTVGTDTLFVNSSTARVGIGTLNPGVKLSVDVTATGVNFSDGLNVKNTTTNSYISIHPQGSTSPISSWNNGCLIEGVPASTGNTIIGSFTNSLVFQTNSRTERMRINSNGNIGINTNNPAVTLDVAGRGRFLSAGAGDISGAVTLREDSSSNPAYIQWVNNDNTINRGNIVVDNNSNMKFITSNSEKLNIDSSGNITSSVIGALASSLLPTDTILQVQFSTSTTESFHETTNAALPFSNTNVSCSITPKRSNSRIIILCSLATYLNGTEPRNEIRIMQQIGSNPATELANSRHAYVGYTAGSEAWLGNNFICCSDIPNTSNTCTYTIQARPGRVTTGTYTVTHFRVNHNPVDWAVAQRSSMILVEIAN